LSSSTTGDFSTRILHHEVNQGKYGPDELPPKGINTEHVTQALRNFTDGAVDKHHSSINRNTARTFREEHVISTSPQVSMKDKPCGILQMRLSLSRNRPWMSTGVSCEV
jgi:hypothetical protein